MTKNKERLQQWLDQPEPPPQPEEPKPRWVYPAALIGALLAPLALFLWMMRGRSGGVAGPLWEIPTSGWRGIQERSENFDSSEEIVGGFQYWQLAK